MPKRPPNRDDNPANRGQFRFVLFDASGRRFAVRQFALDLQLFPEGSDTPTLTYSLGPAGYTAVTAELARHFFEKHGYTIATKR